MNIIKTNHPEVFLLEPKIFCDNRGWFMETWNEKMLIKAGLNRSFVQENHSLTKKKGTLRGIHFQNHPMAQCKLVRCIAGAILDVAIDLRKDSPYYLTYVTQELSADNKKLLFIPRGFAHAFLTITDNVEIIYNVDNFYSIEHDRSIKFDDPMINIDWGIKNPILSDKDLKAPLLSNADCNY